MLSGHGVNKEVNIVFLTPDAIDTIGFDLIKNSIDGNWFVDYFSAAEYNDSEDSESVSSDEGTDSDSSMPVDPDASDDSDYQVGSESDESLAASDDDDSSDSDYAEKVRVFHNYLLTRPGQHLHRRHAQFKHCLTFSFRHQFVISNTKFLSVMQRTRRQPRQAKKDKAKLPEARLASAWDGSIDQEPKVYEFPVTPEACNETTKLVEEDEPIAAAR